MLALLLLLLSGEPRHVAVTAKRFTFTPAEIHLRKGEDVVLELTTLDRTHGFEAPELGLSAEIEPGKTTRLRLTPSKTGTFEFHCNVFCGSGHEEMSGRIVVEE